MLTMLLKLFDTIVVIATTYTSIFSSVTGVNLIAIPVTAATAYGISISYKIVYEIVTQKYNIYRKHYEKHQQTIKSCDEHYRKVFKIMYLMKTIRNLYIMF